MEINQLVKTENGVVEFKGTLTDDEVNYILTVGLITLLENGSLSVPDQYIDVDESISH